jgi:hypothetical protein
MRTSARRQPFRMPSTPYAAARRSAARQWRNAWATPMSGSAEVPRSCLMISPKCERNGSGRWRSTAARIAKTACRRRTEERNRNVTSPGATSSRQRAWVRAQLPNRRGWNTFWAHIASNRCSVVIFYRSSHGTLFRQGNCMCRGVIVTASVAS